ncbi:MAG: hypothetical protein V4636_20325 [Pseudomonadota bacterium]
MTSATTFTFGGAAHRSEVAKGKPAIDPDRLRLPNEEAKVSRRMLRREARAAAATGGARPLSAEVDQTGQSAAVARERFDALFPGGRTAAHEKAGRDLWYLLVDVFGTNDSLPFERPMLMAEVLSRFSRRNPLEAARLLADLQGGHASDASFEVERTLARSLGPGIACLWQLQPPHLRDGAYPDPTLEAIRKTAFRQRVLAADVLCNALPPRLRPGTMADCMTVAREVAAARRSPPENRLGMSIQASILMDEPIVPDALLAADALWNDAGAALPPAQQQAYFAFRNGIVTEHQLQKTTERLYKLNTYMERAGQHGKDRFVGSIKRGFGTDKSPFNPLMKLGTAGSKTRHPEDDLALRTLAMDGVVEQLNAQLAALPLHRRPDDATLHKSITVAIIRNWKMAVVRDGWKGPLRVHGEFRRRVAHDVSVQLGVPALVVMERPELKRLHELDVDVLDRIVRREGIDTNAAANQSGKTLATAMTDFRGLRNRGDTTIRHPTREQVRATFRQAINDTRMTYNVRFTVASNTGVDFSPVSLALGATNLVGLPGLGVGPSVSLAGTKSVQIGGGSNVHGGEIFVGAGPGASAGAALSASLGYKLADYLNVGPSAGLGVQADTAHWDAAVVRTRMDTIGSTDPNAWRDKLLDVYDVMTLGADGNAPQDARSMWNAMAGRFHKDPNVSVGAHDFDQQGLGVSGQLGVSARLGDGTGPTAGPGASVGFGKNIQSKTRRHDESGARQVQLNANSAGHNFSASAGFTGAAPGIKPGQLGHNAGDFGKAQGIGLPSANLGTVNVSVMRGGAGVTFRMVSDGGRVDADYSVKDTEFAKAKHFAQHIDAGRAEWVAALGGGPEAQRRLDEFLTQLLRDDKRGNVTYGERRRLTTEAARSVDYYRALAVTFTPPDRPPTDREAAQIRRLDGEVTRVLGNPANWDPRSLWALDLNLESRTKGPRLVLAVQHTERVEASRQRAALIAQEAPARNLVHTYF